ncbi:MAG: RNA 2',3'-cyclic phosphodiesterase [Candidatus Obscuribacterales bacterium]|nr:RNA 2',3'-cyclic phosphodiesterase [Candidatus Obscuribacterales bacterium]
MSPENKTRRLFVGTYLSPAQQEVLGYLSERKAELEKQWHCRARIVKPIKLHLTWLFLGDVEGKLDEITAKLQSTVSKFSKLSINFDQVEFWPSAKRPRMVVMTPSVIPDRVMEIAAEIQTQLKPYVSKPGHREYRPHITLARLERESVKANAVELPDWLVSKCVPLTQQIEKIELIESELGCGGDEYASLLSFELGYAE